VVSLLAVGTVGWWQRTPGPINAPRPQDEAEIMTAVLERHYAMGRTRFYFATSKDANVAQVITNIGGTNCITNITISAAYSVTNTIGFMPNAVNTFPFAIRLALLPQTKTSLYPFDYWDNLSKQDSVPAITKYDLGLPDLIRPLDGPTIGWIVPDDAYMNSGDMSWFGSYPATNVFPAPAQYWSGEEFIGFDDTVITWYDTYFSRQRFVWTNYVTLNAATYNTLTNYQYEIVDTNTTPQRTNILMVCTNYTGGYNVNTYYSVDEERLSDQYFHIYAIAGMMFPFERDFESVKINDPPWRNLEGEFTHRTPVQWWSTNAYRDMGRALSILQWAKNFREAETQVVVTVTWTNATGGSIWNGGSYEGTTVSTNFENHLIYDKYFWRYHFGSCGDIVSSSWVSHTPTRKARLTITITLRKFSYYNESPFTIDTVHVWPEGAITNGAIPYAWTNKATLCETQAPYSTLTMTNLWPDTVTAAEAWARSVGDNWQTNDIPGLPAYSIPWNRGEYPENGLFVAYHVQFTALTNYLNHAPAR
jgi:hypothetical protein